MQKLAEFVIDSKIFISICSVCITICTFQIFETPFSLYPQFLILIFSSTFIIYNFPSYAQLFDPLINQRFKLFYIYSFPILIASIVLSSLKLPLSVFLFFFHLGVFSLLYYIPVKNSFARYSLRNIPFLKIFLIAYVWGAATVIAPSLLYPVLEKDLVAKLFLDRVIFILAITIPFDIRDQQNDKQLSIKTLPHLLGTERSKMLSVVLLLLYAMNSLWYQEYLNILISRILAVVILCFFLISLKESSSKFICNGYIDGSMIIQLCLLILSHLIIL